MSIACILIFFLNTWNVIYTTFKNKLVFRFQFTSRKMISMQFRTLKKKFMFGHGLKNYCFYILFDAWFEICTTDSITFLTILTLHFYSKLSKSRFSNAKTNNGIKIYFDLLSLMIFKTSGVFQTSQNIFLNKLIGQWGKTVWEYKSFE